MPNGDWRQERRLICKDDHEVQRCHRDDVVDPGYSLQLIDDWATYIPSFSAMKSWIA
jgi:hypothetical protein